MKRKPDLQGVVEMTVGAAVMLVIILVILHFRTGQTPAEQLALKTRASALAAQMQTGMAAASEAEKSAVLAPTDEASQTFADQARAATADVERERGELAALLKSNGDQAAQAALAQFTEGFAEFQRVDRELLTLAVQNTNLKAYDLAFGPAAAALHEMDSALIHVAVVDEKTMRLADTARIAAWRMLTLIPPHIAEESEPKMNAMETQMAAEDDAVRRSLTALAAFPLLAGNADLKAAAASYARFSETRAQILKFSRANTNVRSLSISLNQKRNVMLVCQAALISLQQAIQAEPIAGMTYGTPVRPRGL